MRTTQPLIVLMTDFGLQDPYAGVMKGVIAGISPHTRVIDLTHCISAQNILHGALLLGSSAPYFPDGTIFTAVVDPGVGTARNAIALVTEKQVFIAPDNGLLSSVMKTENIKECFAITNPSFMLAGQSATFHGRDVFSPAAAHLANGVEPSRLGKAIDPDSCIRIGFPENSPCDSGSSWEGTVLYADVYGNLITSFTGDMITGKEETAGIRTENGDILSVYRTYADVAQGVALAYTGSSGFLEIAIRNGNASGILGLEAGDRITLLLNR
ncbi:MAG: SAM-dependent chlorinase/fluorinase [Chlorobium phaeobacteroides]|uniref:Uncharacterized protein n=1 Tax=Chlorobium phaeobacteroides (strain BS1) TaxID=331678 RepID=B3EMK5_CHLPB|nr:SAM-dependent chlorinase/fluorinase [Chlorobium phaeobacteroides]